jgi:hypothetical protein
MKITAKLQPLNLNPSMQDPFYEKIYSKMQMLGLLMPFKEQLNWDKHYELLTIGKHRDITSLKRLAARNDGLFLWYAKLQKNTVFQHLILHSLSSGYALPFTFEKPFTISSDGQSITFCSSKKLYDECSWLDMQFKKDHGNNQEVMKVWQNLKYICSESIKKSSPVKLQVLSEDK